MMNECWGSNNGFRFRTLWISKQNTTRKTFVDTVSTDLNFIQLIVPGARNYLRKQFNCKKRSSAIFVNSV